MAVGSLLPLIGCRCDSAAGLHLEVLGRSLGLPFCDPGSDGVSPDRKDGHCLRELGDLLFKDWYFSVLNGLSGIAIRLAIKFYCDSESGFWEKGEVNLGQVYSSSGCKDAPPASKEDFPNSLVNAMCLHDTISMPELDFNADPL